MLIHLCRTWPLADLSSPFRWASAMHLGAEPEHSINTITKAGWKSGHVRRGSPFKQIFGLPSLDNGPLTEAGKWRLNLVGSLANAYTIAAGPQEKLTNDVETFSGRLIASHGLTPNDPHTLEKYRLARYGGLAGVFLGGMDGELAPVQKTFVLAGRAGVGWQATKLIQLKLQLDAQSAIYDSQLKEMGDPAFQLAVGGSLTFTDDVYLDIAVAEDINTSTAPDVVFQLGLVLTF